MDSSHLRPLLPGQEFIASDFVNHFIPLKALGGFTGGALGLAAGGYVAYLNFRAPTGAVFFRQEASAGRAIQGRRLPHHLLAHGEKSTIVLTYW